MSEWYYAINRRQMGPVTEPELRELASAGALRPNDLVWKDGSPEWVQAGTCAELFPAGLPDPARGRSRDPGVLGYDDDGRRRFDDDGHDDDLRRRRRPTNQGSGAGWIVSLCVAGVLLAFMVVGVILYFVVANGPGHAPRPAKGPFVEGKSRVWEDHLSNFNAPDPTRNGCFCKTFSVQMTAGTKYQIDMQSGELDAYLRLEDPNGIEVAFDDDSGGGVTNQDARIIHIATQTGMYKIYATTCDPDQEGDFVLKVSP